jgi:UDP-glucose 4-epimerase
MIESSKAGKVKFSLELMPQPEHISILGGLGFMGSHIARELVNRGYSVRIFDKLYASRKLINDFEASVEIVEGDVSRPEDVLSAIADTDIVINLIHTTVPGSSMSDPAYDITSNVAAAANWLQQLATTRVRKIFYFSSGGTVYGIPENIPITEDHPTNPINSYGITKLAIEKYTAMYAKQFGINYSLLRPSNVYGPGQRLHIGQGVIGVLANKAMHGEGLELWGSGTNLRDYLFVDDLVGGVMALLSYNGPFRVFNLSGGKGHSVLDIISILRNQLSWLPEVVHLPARGFDAPVNILDPSRIHGETGWGAAVELEDGVTRTVEWIRSMAQ